MNSYEAKQEERRTRLLAAADRAAAESNARSSRAMSCLAGIEPGQPILIGHHSESRHRAALRRHDQNMRKAVELQKRAEELRGRAAGIAHAGISAEDPDAVPKLTTKASGLEAERDAMKAANAYWRKNKTLDGCDIPESIKAKAVSNMRGWVGVYSVPFPPYALQNLGARIRATKGRVENIERAPTVEDSREEVGNATIQADSADNRVLLRFGARLSRDHYKLVRSHGFVWSPTREAFVRRLSPGALEIAKRCALAIVPAAQQ